MDYKKFRQAKAIEASNKKKLLKVNPKLDEGTGIYIYSGVPKPMDISGSQ